MKFYSFRLFVILSLSIVFTSCDWLDSNSTATTSSDATFTSLTFTAANTADAALSQAVFSLVIEGSDSIIVNLDSLPYNTAIDSVIPKFTFASSNAAYVLVKDSAGTKIDTITITGKDTLDFNRVVKIKNFATDGKAYHTYSFRVNVHKVEPELYQWKNVVNQIYTHQGTLQKAVMMNNTIYFFNSTGLTTSLYTSTTGAGWSNRTSVTDLPDNALLRNMLVFNNKLFLFHNDSLIYSSTNGVDWTKKSFQNTDYWFKNLLYDFKGKLWALVQNKSNGDYKFATSEDGALWTKHEDLVPANFPVGGYAAVSFLSRTKQPKVLVAGGYSKTGAFLNKVWSSQDGLYFVEFSKENTTYGYRTGTNIIYYEDKLLAFGGVDENGKMQPLLYIQSADEGLSWKNIDTTYMSIREKYTFNRNDSVISAYKNYKRRFNHSAVVDKDKNIILIGGRDSLPQTYSDVWVGRLNKAIFIIK